MSGSVSQHVWVAGIRLTDGIGYSSVNRTSDGAEKAVLDWYKSFHLGMRYLPDFYLLDYEDDVESFYCHLMPVMP